MKFQLTRSPLAGAACASLAALALATTGSGALAQTSRHAAHQKPVANNGYLPLTTDLTAFNMANMAKYGQMYFPKAIDLSTVKPAGITKEPAYKGAPKYGTVQLGNGPNSTFIVAVDEAAPGECRVYIDKNRNGDLTDDGGGTLMTVKKSNGNYWYGPDPFVLRASYGTPTKETSHADYALGMYGRGGMSSLFYVRNSARVGSVVLAGKRHKAILVENDSDGVYSKPVDMNGDPVNGGKPSMAVWLLVDTGDLGFVGKGATIFDIRSPFVYQGHNYEALVPADGSRILVRQTTRALANLAPKAPPEPPLKAAGTAAPDFTVETMDGSTLKLSDYKGKVVILDFWATWCGPCNAAMPHLEKVYEKVKDQGVVVLGVCVSDERQAFKEWVTERSKALKFTFAYDTNGTAKGKSVSGRLYGVSGIPTTFIIDKQGNIVESIVGFGGENDNRIEKALAKLKVEVASK